MPHCQWASKVASFTGSNFVIDKRQLPPFCSPCSAFAVRPLFLGALMLQLHQFMCLFSLPLGCCAQSFFSVLRLN